MREIISVLHPYLLLSVGSITLFISLLMIFTGVKNIATYGFVHSTISIAAYQILYGVMSFSSNLELGLILSYIGQLFINQISPGFYLFTVYFLEKKNQKKMAWVSILIGFFTAFFMFSVRGQVVRHFWWGNFNVYPLPEAIIPLTVYYTFFFGLMVLSFNNLRTALREEMIPTRRTQIKQIFLAFFIAYMASWDHLPIMGVDVYAFGYIFLIIFVFMVFHAIIRYQFLDVRIGLKRLSLVAAIYAFLFLVALPITIPISKILLGLTTASSFLKVLFFGVGVGLLFSSGPFIYAILIRNSYWLKGHLTAGLTHELKSPLSAIQSALEMTREEIEKSDLKTQKSTDYLDMIERNVNRLDKFVKELLLVAREEQTVDLKKDKTDIKNLLQSIIDEITPLSKDISISLTCLFKREVNIDQKKIHQVFSNLLSNAIKFSNQKPIEILINQNGPVLLCSVTDHGIGLSPKNMLKIFDRFYKVDPNSKGSGIGLAIAKAWVEAHGGKIWAESEGEGKGTTMKFTLPL